MRTSRKLVVWAKAKCDYRIENFSVLDDHFHFIIQPMGESNLFEIMKWILRVFAQKDNRTFKIWGHFWGDRFFSRPIASFWEYIRVFEYIDDNPVKACQVQRADEWRHGRLWHFRRGLRDIVDTLPEWLALLFPGHRSLVLA